ncbi:MAG: TIR domain-containing protein, partial [Planctomycetaceae bacterium]|nr:TIR domain-containing protein [Planctomycetaceae bacterium]
LTRYVVGRKHYELSGGFRVSRAEIPSRGIWSVWGVIDLGFAALPGRCLVLGEIPTPDAPVRMRKARGNPFSLLRAGLARLFSPLAAAEAPEGSRTCPRCGGVRTRLREVRRDWICDDCDHRWSGHSSVGATFLSYRRDGASEIARALRSELIRRGIKTFLDVDDLRSHFYDERLLREIESAPNFLLVLSPGCLDRCVDPDDWLRKEILHAMQHDRNIVPILTKGFEFPRPANLTPELRDLPRYNCVEYSHAYFSATIQKLVDFMKMA